jgi:hypothetical protein
MSWLTGRALIESRYGPLGSGGQILRVGGVEYTVAELLRRIGIGFDDSVPIDVVMLSEGHYAIRYCDEQDQCVVAQEFDADFRLLGETRAHIAEWLGEQAYFSMFGGH